MHARYRGHANEDTLKYMRSDTARSKEQRVRRRDDPRLGGRMVALDGDPQADRVRTVLVGVADDRGVGLAGGRMGAIEGPLRFRDYFWRMHAPVAIGRGRVLDAGDMVSAARTGETHARLTEVIDVLRERFEDARFIVVGGGHDHVYGEILGVARWLRRQGKDDIKIAHVCIDARANVHAVSGEPHAGGPLRRLLLERSTRVDGSSLLVWGLQRAASAEAHLAFLRSQGAELVFWDDIEDDPRAAATDLAARIGALAEDHHAVTLSLDLCAFDQATAPGVSDPSPVGVSPAGVLRAVRALGSLTVPTQFGIYGLNPRVDRDGATARLAAHIAWTYATTGRMG